jgi:hypothetical protein
MGGARLVGTSVVLLAFGLALMSCAQAPDPPRLIVDESVASDLEALALDAWDQFLAEFEARYACFGDVTLQATKSLESRAGYDPERATVTVRVPATAAMLQGALVHEWAHHIEFQCPDHQALRPVFLAAQGLPPDTAWRPDIPPADIPASMWPDIPSEQWAEATIVAVLGRRQIATGVRVKPGSVDAIRKWAAGN